MREGEREKEREGEREVERGGIYLLPLVEYKPILYNLTRTLLILIVCISYLFPQRHGGCQGGCLDL